MASEEEYQTDHGERDSILVEDEALQGGFVMLPKVILHAQNLSRDAKILYAILVDYAWQERRCFPGYARLCEDMGASEPIVRKYMRELEEVGLLTQKRRGLGKTNLYVLLRIACAQLSPLASRTKETFALDRKLSAALEPKKARPLDRKKPYLYKDSEDKDTYTTPPVAPQRGARSPRRRHDAPPDPARFTTGAYAVCAACGCNPCDKECPTLQETAASAGREATSTTLRGRRSPAR